MGYGVFVIYCFITNEFSALIEHILIRTIFMNQDSEKNLLGPSGSVFPEVEIKVPDWVASFYSG